MICNDFYVSIYSNTVFKVVLYIVQIPDLSSLKLSVFSNVIYFSTLWEDL